MKEWLIALVFVLFLAWSSEGLLASNPVYFADQHLKQAVEKTLGVADPTPEDMGYLTHLNAYDKGISDLEGLQYAGNLVSLDLRSNNIVDITYISHLPYLETLDMGNNYYLEDISAIAALSNLKELSLSGTQVSDIYLLSTLPQLEELKLQGTPVNNIIWLGDLTNLKHLNLGSTDVSDISALENLTYLEYLSLNYCLIGDISILSNMTNLHTLLLNSTSIRDISPLTQLTNLTLLDINGARSLNLSAYCSDIATIEANNPGIQLDHHPFPIDTDIYCDVDLAGLIIYADNWFYFPDIDQIPSGNIITVDDDGPADYSTIQGAINASTDGDVVKVMPGYYTGEGNYNLNFGSGLIAGQTRTITVCSSNANDPNIVIATIIDAQGQGSVFRFVNDEGPECIIAGLTITGGDAKHGAGIYCGNNASPTISNCIIAANTGLGHLNGSMGGGIYCGGSGLISNCVIAYNYSDLDGGGIYVANEGEVFLTNCTFVRNFSSSGGGCYLNSAIGIMANCLFIENESLGTAYHQGGGAIYTASSNIELEGCYFEANRAAHGGAARFSGYERKYMMHNCTFFDNIATEKGGAVYCEAGQYDFKDSIFGDNSAKYGGGLYFTAQGNFYFYETGYLSRCWIYGNHASQDGGAVYLDGTREDIFWKEGYQWTEWCWIDNCEIKGNRADRYGGGIYIDYPDTMIRNCTIAGNLSIQNQGGAIYCVEQTEPQITNNIITDNLGVAITVADYAQPSISYNNFWNNIDGNYEGLEQQGAGNKYLDSKYKYPGSWEGDLSTPMGRQNARWNSGRFELTEDSPCINAGENHWVRDWEADIEHHYRINDGVVDMGAHEFHQQSANPVFNNSSNDLSNVPYFHAKPGDQRIFRGKDGTYTDFQYRHEFSNEVLSFGGNKQINCLRWEQTGAPSLNRDGRPLNIADFVMFLAKDTNGKLWLLGREENGRQEIIVEDTAHAISFDDVFGIDAHLMSGRDDNPDAYVNAYYEIVDKNGEFVVNYQKREGFLQVKKLYSWSTYLSNQPTYVYYDQNKGLAAEHWGYISGPNPPFASWYLDDTQPWNEMDGYLKVDKCTVVANSDRSNPNDKLLVSLSEMDVYDDDFSGVTNVILRLYNKSSLSPRKMFTFVIPDDKVGTKNCNLVNDFGRMKFNFVDGEANVVLRGIDLSGLTSPIQFEVEVGSYLENGLAYDGKVLPIVPPHVPPVATDVVNGAKPMPIQLLSGYEDTLRVDKHKFKPGTKKPNTDYLMIQGAITVHDTSVDISEENIVIRWGNYSVPLLANDMFRIGEKKAFKYKKTKGSDSSVAAAVFDLDKCTFKIIIKKADIGPQDSPVEFGISFGTFDETVEVVLP